MTHPTNNEVEKMVLGGRDKWPSGTVVVREKDHHQELEKAREEERERINKLFHEYISECGNAWGKFVEKAGFVQGLVQGSSALTKDTTSNQNNHE